MSRRRGSRNVEVDDAAAALPRLLLSVSTTLLKGSTGLFEDLELRGKAHGKFE